MAMNSNCPECPCNDCATLNSVSRIVPARWWQRLLTGRRVRRIVTGYIQQCPMSNTTFMVTDEAVRVISRKPSVPSADGTEATPPRPRVKREEPMWPAPPEV